MRRHRLPCLPKENKLFSPLNEGNDIHLLGEPIIPGVIWRHWGVFASGKPADEGVTGSWSDSAKSWSSLGQMEGSCANKDGCHSYQFIAESRTFDNRWEHRSERRYLKAFTLHVRRAEHVVHVVFRHGLQKLTHLLLPLQGSHPRRYDRMIWNWAKITHNALTLACGLGQIWLVLTFEDQ